MKSNISIVVWMIVVSILLKLIVYIQGWQFSDFESIAIFGNVFVLMTGVFLGIRLFKIQNGKTSFPQDFKAGIRVASLYTLAMTAFVYVYYSFIDAAYFKLKLQKQLELAQENGMNLEQVKQTGEVVLSPFFQSTITLIGFLLLGSFYSAILSFLMRKFPSFKQS